MILEYFKKVLRLLQINNIFSFDTLLRIFIQCKITHKHCIQTVVLSIKINLFCFVYYLAEQMVVVWHNSVLYFSCCFLLGRRKKTAHKPELLFPLCHSWLPINLNPRCSDDSTWCPGARYDWVTFFSNVHIRKREKKISL